MLWRFCCLTEFLQFFFHFNWFTAHLFRPDEQLAGTWGIFRGPVTLHRIRSSESFNIKEFLLLNKSWGRITELLSQWKVLRRERQLGRVSERTADVAVGRTAFAAAAATGRGGGGRLWRQPGACHRGRRPAERRLRQRRRRASARLQQQRTSRSQFTENGAIQRRPSTGYQQQRP